MFLGGINIHSLEQSLQQQQQQQQQLYRGLSTLPQQDSAHFLNNASRQPNPFPSQGKEYATFLTTFIERIL